jgi:predicted AAA+ superfamily ATPase
MHCWPIWSIRTSSRLCPCTSERQRNSNPRKVYPADPGLIHAFDLQGRANLGHALETVVFNELQRRGAAVEYIKTADGFEVDFHVRHRAGDRALLQVCADPASPQTRARELRALGSAVKENPKLPAALLVLTQEQAVALSAEPFRIVPAYEWMLEQ